MRHSIELFLRGGEWLEDKRAAYSVWRVQRKQEKKSVFTFLSQGAVGGMIGYFLIAVFFAISQPTGYNFIYLVGLPIILIFGSTIGAVAAVFVWLPSVLLERRLGFVARAGMATAGVLALGYAFSFVSGVHDSEHWSIAGVIAIHCAISLPIATVTGSGIRPCRLMAVGSGPLPTRHHIGSWLAIPLGFLLRVTSIFALLEALMLLALWIAARTVAGLGWPTSDDLTAIGLMILYFLASAYLSVRSPRKSFLLPIAILVNLTLVGLIELSKNPETLANNLRYVFGAFLCLWAGYVLGRLIAPESAPELVDFEAQTPAAQKAPGLGDCQVQL